MFPSLLLKLYSFNEFMMIKYDSNLKCYITKQDINMFMIAPCPLNFLLFGKSQKSGNSSSRELPNNPKPIISYSRKA